MSDTKPRPRAWKVMTRIAQAIAFSTVEALAAHQIGGILGVLLWAIVAWNLAYVVLVIWGIAQLADERLRETKGESS